MAIERNPNNPKLALNRTQPPTPNETRSAINTANQCAIEVDELWRIVKSLQEQVNQLMENSAKPSSNSKKTRNTGKGNKTNVSNVSNEAETDTDDITETIELTELIETDKE